MEHLQGRLNSLIIALSGARSLSIEGTKLGACRSRSVYSYVNPEIFGQPLGVGVEVGMVDASDRKHFHRELPTVAPSVVDGTPQCWRRRIIENQAQDPAEEGQRLLSRAMRLCLRNSPALATAARLRVRLPQAICEHCSAKYCKA